MNTTYLVKVNNIEPKRKIVGYVLKEHNELKNFDGKVIGSIKPGVVIECTNCKKVLLPEDGFYGKCGCGHYWLHPNKKNFFEYA